MQSRYLIARNAPDEKVVVLSNDICDLDGHTSPTHKINVANITCFILLKLPGIFTQQCSFPKDVAQYPRRNSPEIVRNSTPPNRLSNCADRDHAYQRLKNEHCSFPSDEDVCYGVAEGTWAALSSSFHSIVHTAVIRSTRSPHALKHPQSTWQSVATRSFPATFANSTFPRQYSRGCKRGKPAFKHIFYLARFKHKLGAPQQRHH